ncbi:MAG: ribosome-associated translation inhibitor RaiA [Helicobacteraceae bacterium]|jgi:putative sigma-54 modulation protein|nr:ribosome-associated translation inhibitor RaiA [Helicobacteraceae bacterium]
MNASIVARKLELTESMREYIAKAVDQLEKYNLDIIAVKTIVEEDGKHGKPAVLVEFTIQLARKDTIVIKQTDKDFYVAADIAVERAKKALRRYKDRVSDKIGLEVPHKYESDIPALYSDVESAEVIETAPEFSFTIDEALAYVKETSVSFVAFSEKNSGKLRALYRRKDGRFGLY